MKQQSAHWHAHAAKWRDVGPPLRPCAQDIAIFENALRDWTERQALSRPARMLLLGVTPEIALMQRPAASHLVAVDYSLAMIAGVWPAQQAGNASAVCADWRVLPLAPDSIDFIVADGCFTQLPWPNGYREVAGKLHQVLSSHGCLASRFFVRPDVTESLDAILEDIIAGRIASFHAFKWRLAMALHGNHNERGVQLARVWEVWRNTFQQTVRAHAQPHWTPEIIATIDHYQGVETFYSFPKRAQIYEAFSEYFSDVVCLQGDYELAERCPIILFRSRK